MSRKDSHGGKCVSSKACTILVKIAHKTCRTRHQGFGVLPEEKRLLTLDRPRHTRHQCLLYETLSISGDSLSPQTFRSCYSEHRHVKSADTQVISGDNVHIHRSLAYDSHTKLCVCVSEEYVSVLGLWGYYENVEKL